MDDDDKEKDTIITCQDGKKLSFFSFLLRHKSKVFQAALKRQNQTGKFCIKIDATSDIVELFLSSLSSSVLSLRQATSKQLETLVALFHQYDIKDCERFCVEIIISRLKKPKNCEKVELYEDNGDHTTVTVKGCGRYVTTAFFPRCQPTDATDYYRYASLGATYHHKSLIDAALNAIATPKKSDIEILEAIGAPPRLYKELFQREAGARLEIPRHITREDVIIIPGHNRRS
eukprot:gb/GEZN01008033.1/.p1 GENE.gb/GEZN01008033.1/~~gb/GEZN01008033.1/.p1  ORF type:complete len:231 (-),score=15.78 gb/GEZN01008033.1/:722-1414(-)